MVGQLKVLSSKKEDDMATKQVAAECTKAYEGLSNHCLLCNEKIALVELSKPDEVVSSQIKAC